MLGAAVCEAVAFLVGALTDIPALRQFCLVAATAVAVGFVLQVSCTREDLLFLCLDKLDIGGADFSYFVKASVETFFTRQSNSFFFFLFSASLVLLFVWSALRGVYAFLPSVTCLLSVSHVFCSTNYCLLWLRNWLPLHVRDHVKGSQ